MDKKLSKRARIVSHYKGVFSGPSGRAVLTDLAKSCHMTSSTFDPNPQIQAFKEGQRDMFIGIMKILKMDHEKLMDEATKQSEVEEQW